MLQLNTGCGFNYKTRPTAAALVILLLETWQCCGLGAFPSPASALEGGQTSPAAGMCLQSPPPALFAHQFGRSRKGGKPKPVTVPDWEEAVTAQAGRSSGELSSATGCSSSACWADARDDARSTLPLGRAWWELWLLLGTGTAEELNWSRGWGGKEESWWWGWVREEEGTRYDTARWLQGWAVSWSSKLSWSWRC